MTNGDRLDHTPPLALTQTIKDDGPLIATASDSLLVSTLAEKPRDKKQSPVPDIAQKSAFTGNGSEPRYTIGAILGSGGGGDVFTASDHNLNRAIAIKVTPPEKHQDPNFVQKVIREASFTSTLEHQNIPPIYDIDLCTDGRIFYSMKKIEGKPLSSFIKNEEPDAPPTLKPSEIASIFTKNMSGRLICSSPWHTPSGYKT